MSTPPAPVRSTDRPAPARTDRAGRRWRTAPSWLPGLLALLTLLIGLVNLVSAALPDLRPRAERLESLFPDVLPQAAAAATLVVGILLVLLAHGLRRRKRRAWRAVVALLAVSVVLHLLKGIDVEEAGASVVLLGLLLWTSSSFRAEGDPRSRLVAAPVAVLLLGLDLVIGVLIVQNAGSRQVSGSGALDTVWHVLLGLIGVSGPLDWESPRTDGRVALALLGLGVATLLVLLYLVLRPAQPLPRLSADDETRMRELLTRYGKDDSLGYFALREDKSVIWSPSGKSCVVYRVVNGVLLASGDPLGDVEAWPGAIAAAKAEADAHAWVLAAMACSERGGRAYTRAGLAALELGDEAVVETASFSLEGRAMRGVRQAVTRVQRAGYETKARRLGDIDPAEKDRLRAQAAAWRGAETERGFSMALGRIGQPGDEDCVVVTAEQDGVLRGFLHFVPWGRDGLSLDLMRRDRDAENGVNELLITAALSAGKDLGVRRVSLNFAVFRSAFERGERLGAGPLSKGWRGLLVFVSRWFQLESLYKFNAKFQPDWVPRFVCYPTARDLPRVSVAALEAEAFLVRPHLFRRRNTATTADPTDTGAIPECTEATAASSPAGKDTVRPGR